MKTQSKLREKYLAETENIILDREWKRGAEKEEIYMKAQTHKHKSNIL